MNWKRLVPHRFEIDVHANDEAIILMVKSWVWWKFAMWQSFIEEHGVGVFPWEDYTQIVEQLAAEIIVDNFPDA